MNSIVTSGCKTAGNHCLRYHYPKGTLGIAQTSGGPIAGFIIFEKYVDVLNVEYDWMFESGFDLKGGAGKIGPWLAYNTPRLHSGVDIILQWRNLSGKDIWKPATQDPGNGTTIATNGPALPAVGQWAHIKMQLKPGPSGWQKVWVNGTLIHNNGPFTPADSTGIGPIVSFRTWFGGGGRAQAAKWDSYARIDNIHIWSGTGN